MRGLAPRAVGAAAWTGHLEEWWRATCSLELRTDWKGRRVAGGLDKASVRGRALCGHSRSSPRAPFLPRAARCGAFPGCKAVVMMEGVELSPDRAGVAGL